jgi:hypothetical protein
MALTPTWQSNAEEPLRTARHNRTPARALSRRGGEPGGRPRNRWCIFGARDLGRRWRRRQHSSFDLRLESILAMRAIAKWLIVASATATQGDILPSWCTECGTAGVTQLDIAFDAQWTIVSDCDFPRHAHLPSLGVHSSDIRTDIDGERRALASSLSCSTIAQISP